MADKPRRTILWLGMALIVLGIGCALLWTAFAPLYVPECPTFSLTRSNPHCSRPVAWIYAGYSCAALGLGAVVSFALLRKPGKS